MDLDAVAAELYGLAPGEFIAARDALVKQARAAGDRELAAGIKALRRPTAVAWVANQLARRHPGEVRALADLGEQLRAAMAAPSGPQLRTLNAEQRRLVTELVQAARELATASGQPLTDQTTQALTDTLHAALADAAQAQELAAGRLTEGMTALGFGLMPTDGGGTAGPAPTRSEPTGPTGATQADQPDVDAGAALLEQARQAVADAEEDVADARRALIHATAALDRSTARARQAAEHVDQLRAELTEAMRSRDRAQQQEDDAQAAHDGADRAVRAAERALRTSVSALEEAERTSPPRPEG